MAGVVSALTSSFSLRSTPLMGSGIDFIVNPQVLRGFSGSLHLLLLLVMFVSWVGDKLKAGASEGNQKRFKINRCKQALFCCATLSMLNLVLGGLSCFYWYKDGWSNNDLLTSSSFLITSITWGLISVYLHSQISKSEVKLPILLRLWWILYLSVSFYCLVVDIVLSCRKLSLSIQYMVSDALSFTIGSFLCYVGFARGVEVEDTLLHEPLLNGDSSVGDTIEVTKDKGNDFVTSYSSAGRLSLLLFSWMSPLIALGNKKTLNLEDVPELDHSDSVSGALEGLRSNLEFDGGSATGVTWFKLVKALFFMAKGDILSTGFFAFLYTMASYAGPYLIDNFVQYLNGQRRYRHEGYVLVAIFFVAKVVECVSQRHWYFRLQKVGIRTRSALVSMIYDKALKLSCQSKQGQSSGEIVNIMTVDAERIGDFAWYMHDPWLVVLQVGLALAILYRNLGWASMAALGSSIIIMLANFPLGRWQKIFQDKLMESKDARMKATSEILRNMRILKLQGWEMKFLSKLMELRKVEAGWLKRFVYVSAVVGFFFWVAPTLVSVCTFAACMFLRIPLETGKILSALATFRILQEPIVILPDAISMMIQTKVSLDRIVLFLHLEELEPDIVEKLPRGSSDMAIEAFDCAFSWDVSSPNPTLRDVSFKIRHGMRVAVCGMVGSGKSSLLSAVLGEVPKISGTLKVCGTKAYVAQSPWIQSGTVQSNILFGEEMEKEGYDRILEACALNKDLEVLPFGDHTVIGEKGINMSGGQKQRIQIARALYQDADIYLFDDPFSAVDAHTGSHLFKKVLLGVLNSKTVIYVTHQVEFLPVADLILVMKDGRITQAGKYFDILNSGTDFMELVGAHREALTFLDSANTSLASTNVDKDDRNGNMSEAAIINTENGDNKSGQVDTNEPNRQLIQEEEREQGRVGFSVYWSYLTMVYGGAFVPLILLAYSLFQILQIGSSYWMAWATPVSKDGEPKVSPSRLITVYVALAMASAFCLLARSTLLATVGYKTANRLFNKMHSCIFRAPMCFFDATPSGRILNRASTDQSSVDTSIANRFSSVGSVGIQILGVIVVMSQVAWQIFLVFIPVIAISLWYQQYYISAARELVRLIGTCKAPVIQHFAETISGSITIRSFDKQQRFLDTNIKLNNDYCRPKFYTSGAMEWLSFRIDMLASITFVASLVFLVSIPGGIINPSIAGLAVTYGLNLNMLQALLIWILCELENKIISVERILQYTKVPSEPPLEIESNRPDPSWPSHGEIDIRDLQVRYAPHMPLVLKGLTCTFSGGLKTGIVGRTGSGKSTLIQTLFRIVEPTAGQIMIDGINISSIGLHDLRSRLSIIPQDPTMFEGTVRSNMDPLGEYSDEEIWEALDKCQLGDEVRRKEQKLDSAVIENGENWSMGQRQLVCLGRVLLKKSKVLVLDEATASVDTATDNLIQRTLNEHFSNRTVLTIAHRITSVINSDMVLLLSQGLIEEFDSPARLLENRSSSFSQLVAEYTARSNSSYG